MHCSTEPTLSAPLRFGAGEVVAVLDPSNSDDDRLPPHAVSSANAIAAMIAVLRTV